MALSDMGTVPETLPRDAGVRPDRAEPVEDDRQPDRPEADPSIEDILRDAREAARENGTVMPGKIDEAIAASESEVGAAATRDRILSGELTTADGTVLLDGMPQGERTALAQNYESGIRERAAGPAVELTADMADLKNFEERAGGVRSILADHFQDPEAALARLKSLDEREIDALAQGDASVLGETTPGTSLDETEAGGLSAFADDWDQNPEAAARITEAQAQDRARTARDDLDRNPTDAERHEQDPARQKMEDQLSLRDRMEHQIAYAATSVPTL